MEAKAAFTVLKAGSAIAGGLGRRSQAMSQEAQAKSQEYLAETQALQREAVANDDLVRFLSTTRAARTANGLSISSPNGRLLEQDAQRISRRDRLIAKSDDKVRASNFRNAARSYRSVGQMSLVTGAVGGAVPLAQYGINEGWGS